MTAEIQIADIEQELKRQWEEEEAKNQIRANLFNLIIYCHEPRRAAFFQDFVRAIVEKFPCRIIMIQKDPDPSHNSLKVSVSNVVTTKGELTLACDQITIDVTASQMARVPFIILPHFLSDLPIYLLWSQDPAQETEILPYLHSYASKLIIDSECAEDLPTFSRDILTLMSRSKIVISDMNWAAISGWRDLLARTFDNQEKIFQLHGAKTVRILYNGSTTDCIAHPKIRVLYLQAWLAAQMEWKFIEADQQRIKYSNNADQLTIEMIPQNDPSTTPGTIISIEINTYSDRVFAIERSKRLQQAVIHISTQEECAMPFSLPLPDPKKSSAFLREVLYRGAGSHYRRTLEKLAEL